VYHPLSMVIENRMEALLGLCAPYVGEDEPEFNAPPCFEVSCNVMGINNFVIKDYLRKIQSTVPRDLVDKTISCQISSHFVQTMLQSFPKSGFPFCLVST